MADDMTDTTAFDRIMASSESPMIIVTCRAGDTMDGCLVGFSTQCSIDPKRYLACLSHANRTYDLAERAATLVVHVLRDAPLDRRLARLFGEATGYEVDKLDRCEWSAGPDGVPVIAGLDWFAGSVHTRLDMGDHSGFVLDVFGGNAARADESSLAFAEVRDLDAGNPA
jgi:flavin reductase (DIM6/NTAB) family NADH-FMN oxidoreductase RutF